MCENTKKDHKIQKENEKDDEKNADKSLWSEDQKNHNYYYDDAHGYEVYKDEDDE